MTHYTLIGVDPGLVDTGIVVFRIDTEDGEFVVEHEQIPGSDYLNDKAEVVIEDLAEAIHHVVVHGTANSPMDTIEHIFIEQYRDRGTNFVQHGPMRKLETLVMKLLRENNWHRPKLLDNTGVKRVVTREMMELLGAWKFPTTNHRDLQAAARIGLYGALKDPDLNRVLYGIIVERLATK